MEWRNRERDDASGKSLFDLAKKYRQASKQANRGNSYLILFFLAGKNWVRFLTSFTSVCVAETHQQGVFFSFRFVCGNFYFKTIYWSPPDTYFMPLKC